MFCFSLMHMQCSFLDPFWVASSIKGMLKQTCFDTCGFILNFGNPIPSVTFMAPLFKYFHEQHAFDISFSTSLKHRPKRCIKILLKEANHSSVRNVTRDSHKKVTWKYIWEHTPVKNLLAAPSATTNAQHQAIWRAMKEYTLVINHSAAPSVTTNAHN